MQAIDIEAQLVVGLPAIVAQLGPGVFHLEGAQRQQMHLRPDLGFRQPTLSVQFAGRTALKGHQAQFVVDQILQRPAPLEPELAGTSVSAGFDPAAVERQQPRPDKAPQRL